MLPWDQETMMAHPLRLRINSDCSGKHAGMLAACRSQVWPRGSYREADHPLQQRVLRTVLSTTGLPEVRIGVDGCGVPVHGMPLRSMAHLYASLTSPERFGSMEWHARRVVEAMVAEPYVVAGRNRVDTAVMEVAPGVLVKAGAEGLICAALPEHGLGLAVKIADGAHRGAGPALIHALRTLHALTERQVQSLAPFARPSVLGGGRPVGELVAGFDLRRAK